MEALLEGEARVGQIVHERSLFDELVFVVNSHVLDLALAFLKVHVLGLLDGVRPLVHQLFELVAGEHVVEDSELGSGQPREVSDLDVANVEGNQEFVVENQSADPLVVVPAAELSNRGHRSDVEGQKDNSSAGSTERFVMRRDLFGASRFLESVPVVFDGGENERVLLRVVRMNISIIESLVILLVVASAVLRGVFGSHVLNCLL